VRAALDGADVHATMVTGWTPLHDAATAVGSGALEALLAAGATVDAPSLDGLTPLMVAAAAGRGTAVDLLLRAGADPDAPASTGRTPIESALQAGHVRVARALIEAGGALDEGLAVLFVRALLVGRGRRVRFLKPQAPDARYTWAVDGGLPLGPGDLTPVRPFLREPPTTESVRFHAPVDWRVAPGLFGATEAGDGLPSERWSWRQGWTEATQAVLHGEADADAPDAFGNLCLLDAMRAGATHAVEALLAAGADVQVLPAKGCMRGATLLMNAAHEGHEEIVRALLGAGADVDATSPTGWTALMCAAGQGHREVVHTLLRAGADATLRNAQGRTAMGVAQQRRRADVARSLLVAANIHHLRRMREPGGG
jgi:ankyrin repeat protein